MDDADGKDADETAWKRTIDEMDAIADDLEAEGWDVSTFQAGHVAPESPGSGESDRFGFVFVVPGDREAAFREALDRGDYTEYRVFRRQLGDQLYLVVQYADPDRGLAILLAGAADLSVGEEMVAAARRREVVYTHVQLMDWTHLASFRHDDYEAFFAGD